MKINPAVYDNLKWLVQVVLPALATLYIGLAEFWGAPKPLEVAGTITLLMTFLGTLLGISNLQYKKNNEAHAGFLSQGGVDPDTGIPDLQLVVTKNPQGLLEKDTVTLKVGPPPTSVV